MLQNSKYLVRLGINLQRLEDTLRRLLWVKKFVRLHVGNHVHLHFGHHNVISERLLEWKSEIITYGQTY